MGSLTPIVNLLPHAWHDRLGQSLTLLEEIDDRLGTQETHPPRELIFSSLQVEPRKIKVVILGQDPYPNPFQANGLAFSVSPNTAPYPPSLRNILAEYKSDLSFPAPVNGDLSPWVGEGVLLLNTLLTCRPGESLSHSEIGWQEFTRAILESCITSSTVGILWGSHAQKYRGLFAPEMVIESPHPSPLSAYRGFFGSKPFTRSNTLLRSIGREPIDWTLRSA
jgi:uracil-DNA glycosylase